MLPSEEEALADPSAACEVLGGLVTESLQQPWREAHTGQEFLDQLGRLISAQLAGLDADAEELEQACVASLKLARNLCVGCRAAQGHWWSCGVVTRLTERVRSDWAKRSEMRSQAWCDAVPSFIANTIAAHEALRSHALEALFPLGLTAVCALCWRSPHQAFALVQNVAAKNSSEWGGTDGFERLTATVDGHCLLFLLLSLMSVVGDKDSLSEAADAKAKEWVSVFFFGLWSGGAFVPVYNGLRQLTLARLQNLLVQAARAPSGDICPPVGLQEISGRLCSQPEALGLMWHTVHGLISGHGEAPARSPEADKESLAVSLLKDPAFVELALRENAQSLASLAREYALPWEVPAAPSQEACDALGLQPSDLDHCGIPGDAADAQVEPENRAAPEGLSAVCFQELVVALASLAVEGQDIPARLCASLLWVNLGFIDALHHMRFGNLGTQEVTPRPRPPVEATTASQQCQLVSQLRLCATLLGKCAGAPDFVRLTGGLRVILSHCYADPELPMLREVGVFAVRNATVTSTVNQEVMRAMVAERRTVAKNEPMVTLDEGLI